MGTNTEPTLSDTNRRRNRSHPAAFKRSVVEQSYLPDTSVARLARSHGINANQIFAWRKLFRDGGLADATSAEIALIPVTLSETTITVPGTIAAQKPHDDVLDLIEIAVGEALLTIRGKPDAAVLQAVLARLLR